MNRRLFSKKRTAFLALWLLAATGLPSVNAAPPLNTLGFDDMSCRAWVQSRDDAERRAGYIAWLRGFLTGHNYARPGQQVSTISSGTIEQHITRYCNDHPQGSFSDAAMRLSDQFSGRNAPITK